MKTFILSVIVLVSFICMGTAMAAMVVSRPVSDSQNKAVYSAPITANTCSPAHDQVAHNLCFLNNTTKELIFNPKGSMPNALQIMSVNVSYAADAFGPLQCLTQQIQPDAIMMIDVSQCTYIIPIKERAEAAALLSLILTDAKVTLSIPNKQNENCIYPFKEGQQYGEAPRGYCEAEIESMYINH